MSALRDRSGGEQRRCWLPGRREGLESHARTDVWDRRGEAVHGVVSLVLQYLGMQRQIRCRLATGILWPLFRIEGLIIVLAVL